MKAVVNGHEVALFHGATLKHALLKVDQGLYDAVLAGDAKIYDQEGHRVDVGGSVDDGFSYTVKKN